MLRIDDGLLMPVVNPFPVYPVEQLSDTSDAGRPTVLTEQIVRGRGYAGNYASHFRSAETVQPRSIMLSVRGDYGTGKTCLLRDLVHTLRAELGNSADSLMLKIGRAHV